MIMYNMLIIIIHIFIFFVFITNVFVKCCSFYIFNIKNTIDWKIVHNKNKIKKVSIYE